MVNVWVDGELVEYPDDFIAPILVPPPPVPTSLTPLETRRGLRAWGIGKDQVAAFIASIEDPVAREEAEDAWEYATQFDRSNELLGNFAAAIGKAEGDLDQFFRDWSGSSAMQVSL